MRSISTNQLNSVVNEVVDTIQDKQETIAESLILLRLDLVKSDNLSVIMVPTHNVCKPEEILTISNACLHLAEQNPESKIIALTPSTGLNFPLLSRLSHYSTIFKVDRLMHAVQLVESLGVTKLFTSKELFIYNLSIPPGKLLRPQFRLMYQDVLRSHRKFTKNHLVLMTCAYENAPDKERIRSEINATLMPHVVLSDVYIPGLNCSQIYSNGYCTYPAEHLIIDADAAVGMAIDLMTSCPTVSLTPNHDNVFDLIRRHMF